MERRENEQKEDEKEEEMQKKSNARWYIWS